MTPFLKAEWRHLVVANYEVAHDLLAPLVPTGTELDLWQGRALASMVGFRFLQTRVRGVAVPLHTDFDKVNLRFYVCRKVDGEWRRGVVFVKEIVPRLALAWVARWLYEEPYVAMPMKNRVDMGDAPSGQPGHVEYAWKHQGRWSSLRATTRGQPEALRPASGEEFILEHYWGYTARSDGTTSEYEVQHPPWRVWQVSSFGLDAHAGALYGMRFHDALAGSPRSVYVAEGSAVAVGAGARISSPRPRTRRR